MSKEKNELDELYLAAPEVEKAVLGAVIIESTVMHQIAGDFTEGLFHDEKNKIVAKAIISLFVKNNPIDLLTVTDYLKQNSLLKKVGAAYISQLTSRIASTANIETHVRILQQHYLSRYINDVCNESRTKLFNAGNDIFDVYNQLQNKLEDALKDVIRHEIAEVGAIHRQKMAKAVEVAESGKTSGVISGLRNVDNLTNGWQDTDLIIVAGRSGMGKTALAVTLAMNPSMRNNDPIGIFSLEMSKEQLVGRMESSLSGYNVGRIVKNQLTPEELMSLANMCKPLYDAPIYIDDTPAISITEFKIKARKLVRDKGVKLIIVDYLQLMRSGMNLKNREQEVAEISKGLKIVAKELNIPVIALSQLSRNVEHRGGDKKPMLSDLRESGQIEQDADMVVFCYRPEYYGLMEYNVGDRYFDGHGLFMLIVAKHRNGELGEIPLTFVKELTKVVNHGEQHDYRTFQSNTNALKRNEEFDQSNNNVLSLEDENDDERDDLPF